MSTPFYSTLARNREVLGELLHSVSQPLTTLRCSLELSLDEAAERQQETVTAALEQTENVIAMIQLMREYLDAEESGTEGAALTLMPLLNSVIEGLSPLTRIRGVRLQVMGTCSAELFGSELHVRRALGHLMAAILERSAAGDEISVQLEENATGVVLRVEPERGCSSETNPCEKRTPETSRNEAAILEDAHSNLRAANNSLRLTMERARLAIAVRVLENAGAVLTFDDSDPAVVVRIPRSRGSIA